MPPAIKLRAGELPLESLPAMECPMKDLELINVISKIRHVFGGENFIWRTGERCERIWGVCWGWRQNGNSRLRTDGISPVSVGGSCRGMVSMSSAWVQIGIQRRVIRARRERRGPGLWNWD